MYQEGCYALCKAAASYDEGKGKFTTFAVTCISNHITNYLRDTIGGEKGQFLENAYSLDEERDDNSSFLDNAPADDKSFEAIRYLELKNELLEIAKKGGKELLEAANIFILCAEDGISLRSYCKKLGLSYNRLYYHKMILKNLVCQAEAC